MDRLLGVQAKFEHSGYRFRGIMDNSGAARRSDGSNKITGIQIAYQRWTHAGTRTLSRFHAIGYRFPRFSYR